jgi:ergothioneine biosynthesis protein EgtB
MLRSELFKYFISVRKLSEKICQPLEIEDHVVQPITDVSPPKWHLGHTTWFFEIFLLEKFIKGYTHYHPLYNYLLNSYYRNVGDRWERQERGNLSRPTVAEINAYRAAITNTLCELIETISEEKWKEFSQLVILGCNHEQQHQELLLTDIKYILATNPQYPIYQTSPTEITDIEIPESKFIPFDGGVFEIGYRGDGFCYDNELEVHKVYINNYYIQNRLVTNSEYLEFIEDGGYQEFRHWLSDGWDTIETRGWNAPLFWKNIDDEWFEFTLNGLKKLNPHTPVCHVSYYEADAFARWANKRLPTEAEWEVAAKLSESFPLEGNFIDEENYHPMPLAMKRLKDNSTLYQMFGEVWEWTGSSYLPYPGFKAVEGALGEYNGKFMIDQMVSRGGSCATSRNHIRLTYRNFFQPDKRWQFMGIRLAQTP